LRLRLDELLLDRDEVLPLLPEPLDFDDLDALGFDRDVEPLPLAFDLEPPELDEPFVAPRERRRVLDEPSSDPRERLREPDDREEEPDDFDREAEPDDFDREDEPDDFDCEEGDRDELERDAAAVRLGVRSERPLRWPPSSSSSSSWSWSWSSSLSSASASSLSSSMSEYSRSSS
jgi:hypothetical protein